VQNEIDCPIGAHVGSSAVLGSYLSLNTSMPTMRPSAAGTNAKSFQC
jgi:hypothetical protein